MSQKFPNFEDTKIAFKARNNSRLYESYLVFKMLGMNALVKVGTGFISASLRMGLPVTTIIKKTVFKQFCGGTSLDDCDPVVDEMNKLGVQSILDYSVEACEDESALDKVCEEIQRTVKHAATNNAVPFAVFKPTGIVRFSLLELLADKKPLSEARAEEYQRALKRFDSICQVTSEAKVPLLIDAEESWIQAPIDEMVEAMMAKYNKDRVVVYNTLQMYRWDRLDYLRKLYQRCEAHGFKIGIKLVRGAYMEKERERAIEKGYKSPIHKTKEDTDRDFDDAIHFCVEHFENVGIFVGTHNEESTSLFAKLVDEKGIRRDHPNIMFSQLYGMSDNLSFNLSHHGFNAAKYVPYGPVKEVLPYLFRRAEENSSIQGQASRELILISEEIHRRKEK